MINSPNCLPWTFSLVQLRLHQTPPRAEHRAAYNRFFPSFLTSLYLRSSLNTILDTQKKSRKHENFSRDFPLVKASSISCSSALSSRLDATARTLPFQHSPVRSCRRDHAASGSTRSSAARNVDSQRDCRWRDNGRFVTSHSPASSRDTLDTAAQREVSVEVGNARSTIRARSICLRRSDRRRREEQFFVSDKRTVEKCTPSLIPHSLIRNDAPRRFDLQQLWRGSIDSSILWYGKRKNCRRHILEEIFLLNCLVAFTF